MRKGVRLLREQWLEVAAGAIAGALLGWLVSTGAAAIPGLETLTAVRPVIAALAGAACGGALGCPNRIIHRPKSA